MPIQAEQRWAAYLDDNAARNLVVAGARCCTPINAGLLAALTAHAAASDLTLLAGAAGCDANSPLEKARRDLRALLYADGIHDSLYRAVGRTLTTPASVPQQQESACRAAIF